jgi:hypothetical protein
MSHDFLPPVFYGHGRCNQNHETLYFVSPIKLDVMIDMTLGWESNKFKLENNPKVM